MKKKVFLLLGYSQWKYWRQDHDIALYLSKDHTVIYIEKQVGLAEMFFSKHGLPNFFSLGKNMRWISPSLCVLSVPPRLPRGIIGPSWLKNCTAYNSYRISKFLLAQYVKRSLRKTGLRPDIIFCFEPFELITASFFSDVTVCWRVFDEVSLFKGNKTFKAAVEKIELLFGAQADFIFASSRSQYDKRKDKNPHTYYIPNAAEFRRYNKVTTETFPIPEDIQKLPHPILGFLGTLDQRVDISLLEMLSTEHPEWSLVLAGRDRHETVQVIKNLKRNNIYLLGNKPVEKLPAYLQYIDVSIIPYKKTKQTITMLPIKTFEHLAAGKPIVCTDLPELGPFHNVLFIAGNHGEFVHCTEKALSSNTEEKKQERIAVAKQHTWKKRIKEMEGIIGDGTEHR